MSRLPEMPTLDRMYGPVAHDTPQKAVRVKAIGDGLEVRVHNKENGLEIIPFEYRLGFNYLCTQDM